MSGRQMALRMLLDLKVTIKGEEHFLKMKVYNTTCGMDFQAVNHDISIEFQHLDNLTVGEYFVKTIVIDIGTILCDNLDIKKLNNQLRKLALKGKNMLKNKKKCTKFNCSKDVLKGVSLTCMYCQSLTPKDCISSQVADDNRFRCETCLMNDVRSM